MCANEQKTTGDGSAVAVVAVVWSTFTMAGAFVAGVLLRDWFGYLGSWHTPLALLIGALLATVAMVGMARD